MPELKLRSNLAEFFERAIRETIPRATSNGLDAVERSLIDFGLPELYAAFSEEAYFRDGWRQPLGLNSFEWDDYKHRHHLDARRGHAWRLLHLTIGRPTGMRRRADAIEWNQSFAAHGTGAAEYIEHYAEAKAPGLGGLSGDAYEHAITAGINAFAKTFLPIVRSAGLPGSSLLNRPKYRIRILRSNDFGTEHDNTL